MELNFLSFTIAFFLATIFTGNIESQWNSRSGGNSTWQGQRGNYTGFPPNTPVPGNSSVMLDNHYGYRTTPPPPVWAGGNPQHNGPHQSHRPDYRYNSSSVRPGMHGSQHEGGRPWTETNRPSDAGQNNSTRLYPSLEYFRGRH